MDFMRLSLTKIVYRHEFISDAMDELQRHHCVYLLIQGALGWPWDMGLRDILKPTQPERQIAFVSGMLERGRQWGKVGYCGICAQNGPLAYTR